MRVVVLGAGEVGYHVARRLIREQHDVVIIDRSAELIDHVREELDVLAVRGHAASPQVLEDAEIDRADMLIAVTSSDEINLVGCLLARQSGVPSCIARINEPDFRETALVQAGKHIGIDLLINPSQTVAEEVCRLIKTPGAEEAADFLEGRVKLLVFRVQKMAPIVRHRLRDIAGVGHGPPPFLVAAIQRGQETVIPTGNTVIEADDHLLVIGKSDDIRDNLHILGIISHTARRVFIIGGGRVGYNVAHMLEQDEASYDVRLLEQDPARCRLLADRLPGTLVLHGNATDLRLLREEGVADMDAVVAVTNDEGTNLIAALLAKTNGARGVVTLIKRPDLVPLVAALGIDAAISPRLITAGAILRHLRRGQVLSVFTSINTEAETLELVAARRAKIVGKPLSRVRMPAGVLVGAVAHGDEILIPRGDTVIQAGDRVIVFALPAAVPQATRLFGA